MSHLSRHRPPDGYALLLTPCGANICRKGKLLLHFFEFLSSNRSTFQRYSRGASCGFKYNSLSYAQRDMHWHSSLVDHVEKTVSQFDFAEDRVLSFHVGRLARRSREPFSQRVSYTISNAAYVTLAFSGYINCIIRRLVNNNNHERASVTCYFLITTRENVSHENDCFILEMKQKAMFMRNSKLTGIFVRS